MKKNKDNFGKGGTVLYKCRRCGKIDDCLHTPNLAENLIYLGVTGKQLSEGCRMGVTKVHNCKDGNLGIADIIGGKYDKE